MNFHWWQKQLIHQWSRSDAAVMGKCLSLEVACYLFKDGDGGQGNPWDHTDASSANIS